MKKTCKWLVEMKGGEKIPCGAEASYEVTIRGRVGSGKVDVCKQHKAVHDERAMSLRKSRS